ncbi:helix-turn-helix domain-containing protein [Conexibacter sp. JD483]|uniref:TetR/AcrR family transcriptional regulator n=1 Tax=Conexibacter sp. JD483 TaxID=3064471 RepID=UPI00272148CB|nr:MULTISPECIES: TetR/AcrR family transcriptional regulator [unclassified Conexibacter]MDO8185002.1 helix-turn-helix domain-containing protein [Conexibacter sp. CPCC 205706]MDO8198146.1 helix-turn-helix domain-containing protein [Conexibacter sp. CPCC 205762]MDR9368232.1 helix-turn-helix domain-containing protein [Conexibacter sp. JD483]
MRADAARNRAKILDAAREVFSEYGRDAQMDEIARRAGVGVGTVYRNFPTKQSLAVAIVEQRFDAISDWVAREMLTDPDPWRALERSFQWCAEMQLRDRGYAEIVGTLAGAAPAQHLSGGPLGPSVEQVEGLLGLTAAWVERAKAAGVVRADLKASDMPPLYAALASIVQAGVLDWRRSVEIVLDGLRPRPAR